MVDDTGIGIAASDVLGHTHGVIGKIDEQTVRLDDELMSSVP
jgi:hypothetical protein